MNTTYLKSSLFKNRTIRLFFLFIIGVFAASCSKKDETGKDAKNQILEYPIIEIAPRQTTLFEDFPATIEGQQNVEIRPKVDGYIEGIFVDEGSTVHAGQVLFKISAPQFEQEVRTAQADIKIAQADVNSASMQVSKVKPLVEKNIISRYELESAEYALQSRQAALAQSRAKLANAKTNLSYTSVISPVNGVVGDIPYKIGSLVNANTAQPLTTVSNIGNIYAYFSVNEKQSLDFSRNTRGTTIKERLATLPKVTLLLSDGSAFPEKGRIETASGLINTETGSVRVRATFPNPGNIVRSGSSGIVRLPREVNSALLIPQKATYEIQGKKFVYRVDDKSIVRSVEIKAVDSGDGHFFVVQEGLKAGDRIVLEGVAGLREESLIKQRVVNADSIFRIEPAK
jgi:membrane fusion protein (multidrug efflux system)